MQNSNAKEDNPDQTDKKLNTLESLLSMVSIADEQKILEKKNDIYIYLANLRRLEERVGERVKQRSFYQRVISSSSTEKSLVGTAKALYTKIKRVPTKKELEDIGVTEIELLTAINEPENPLAVEINEARNNLKQLGKLGEEAIAAKKNKLIQDPFFRYKFAMTYCETEEEKKDLKIIGIKLLSNPKDEAALNEFAEQLVAKKETAIPLHSQKKDVPPNQKEIYENMLANAAEKEAKVIASESLDNNHIPTQWETVKPIDSFSLLGFNDQLNSANEKYHSLFEQTRTMLALFKKMEAYLTAHEPNYEEYAMGFFREDTQNLQEKLKIEFENAHRQKLSPLERTQSIAIQQLKRVLTKEVKKDLALFKKVGMDYNPEETINSINDLAGYEAFREDYKAKKEELSTKRRKQKEAFFSNKTSMEDTEGVKKAIKALQQEQAEDFLPILPLHRVHHRKNKTMDEGLLTRINNMQSDDWKVELRSPELLLQIGDNTARKNAYKAAMILHCDAVIEILQNQESDTTPNYETFLNDYFPLLPGEKLIQFFDLASPHLEVGTKRIVMDDIESHLASKSADYLEELLKKTTDKELFENIKDTLLIKTVNEKAPEVAQRTVLYSNIEEQLTALNSTQLSAKIKFLIGELDALIANAPYKSPESIKEEQKQLIDQLNALVDIKFIAFISERPVYTVAKNKLKSIIEQKIITPHIDAVKDIKEIKETKIKQGSSPNISVMHKDDASGDAMAETSESIAKNLLSTEETIKETEETIKETNGIALRMQIVDELTTINRDVKKRDKTAIQAVQKSILYFSGKDEIVNGKDEIVRCSEYPIELVQQYEVACKKYPGVMADFDAIVKQAKLDAIVKQAKLKKRTLGELKERVAKRQRIAKGHKTTLSGAAMKVVIPRPKTETRQKKGA